MGELPHIPPSPVLQAALCTAISVRKKGGFGSLACSKRGVLSDEKEGFPKEAQARLLVLFKLPLSVIFCPDLRG